MWTVYKHVNKINGKQYIGITSTDPKQRWGNKGVRYCQKRNGEYNQPAFAKAIEKYGWDNFEHIIIRSDLTKEQAEFVESQLIIFWQTTNPLHGYNIRSGGSASVMAEESINRCRESAKQYMKAVDLLDDNYNLIKTFQSIRECGKELGIKRLISITQCCNGKIYKVMNKYILQWHDRKENNIKELKEHCKNNPYRLLNVELNKEYNLLKDAANSIIQYYKNYLSARSCIIYALDKEDKTAGGYHWITLEDNKDVQG